MCILIELYQLEVELPILQLSKAVRSVFSVGIHVQDAYALSLCFSGFYLPEGCRMFLYSPYSNDLGGAYTFSNVRRDRHFASRMFSGDFLLIILECTDNSIKNAVLDLTQLGIAYRPVYPDDCRGYGDSGDCEVNVNCEEGISWTQQKDGIVRIGIKIGSSAYWCSGSLLNNTSVDYTPLLLTADHCAWGNGGYASNEDLKDWVFYFSYESAACMNGSEEPEIKSMFGAHLLAHGGNTGDTGSDFYLLELDNAVPGNYNPYFNGWDRSNTSSSSGVSIHHPQGDIKKISTYDSPTLTSEWPGNGLPSHWKLQWSPTANGHGVTEGGSSGAPLFNAEGLIIGTLTGGEASCTNLEGPDYYGKFSYHWASNGSDESSQLAPWLDPLGTEPLIIMGTRYGNIAVASFTVDTTALPIGTAISFYDLSAGSPDSWEWSFEEGDPPASSSQNPPKIYYNKYGSWDVSLIVSNEVNSDTLLKKDYIRVEPLVSPNPTQGLFDVYLGEISLNDVEISVFNSKGQYIGFKQSPKGLSAIEIDLRSNKAGLYFLLLRSGDYSSVTRLSVIPD